MALFRRTSLGLPHPSSPSSFLAMERSAARLDGFTDAAFAFALTLLVIGGSAAPSSYPELARAVADIPAFAIGFSFIAMFWFAHVRWRRFRGPGDTGSALLTALLVFLVLVYVQPLRAMAQSFSRYLGASGTPFSGDLGDLFFLYGAGFAAMTATTAALFLECRRNPALQGEDRRAAQGEALIWLILTATGLLSMLLASFDPTERIAPLVYATLPVTIGLFVRLYKWESGPEAAPLPAEIPDH